MSRGLGQLQRDLLAALHEHAHGGAATAHAAACGLTTAQLASAVRYGSLHIDLIERADLVAARRALRGLERRRLLVRLGTLGHDRSCRWHVGAWSFGR